MPPKGVFEIRTPRALFVKLCREYERMKQSPEDQDIALNFFLTAEHIVDWLHPGKSNEEKRRTLRSSDIYLQICSHIANNTKHYEATFKQHDSVKDTVVGEKAAQPGAFAPGECAPSQSRVVLIILLKGKASEEVGESIGVYELASKLLKFWENELGFAKTFLGLR